MFFRNKVFQLGAHGAKEAVAAQNTEKCADKGGANVMAQHVRRLGDLAHCQNNAQNAGNDTHARH